MNRYRYSESLDYSDVEDRKIPVTQTHLIEEGKRFFGKYIGAKREMRKV